MDNSPFKSADYTSRERHRIAETLSGFHPAPQPFVATTFVQNKNGRPNDR